MGIAPSLESDAFPGSQERARMCEEGWWVVGRGAVLTPGSFSIVQKLDMDIDFRSTF